MHFSITIHRIFFIALFLLVLCTGLQSVMIGQKTPEVVSSLIDSLFLPNPVILDIRCGEWTSALEREVRQKLISQGVDVRETNIGIGILKDNNDLLPLAMESDFGINGKMFLDMLNLQKADILEFSLDQSMETGEKRKIFSYARYSAQVYHFKIKQIRLPEQRLIYIKDYKITGALDVENPGSLLAMKWYEPIIASAILGSLVFMLWTLK